MKLGRLSLLFFTCALLVGMASATSPDQCYYSVYDKAGVFGNRANDVLHAADSLKSQGVDLHIIALPRLAPGEKTSNAVTNYVGACDNMMNGRHTDVNENFMGMFFFTDGKHDAKGTTGRVALLVGGAWDKKIHSKLDGIRDNYIMPSFRSLDFAGAAINGIHQTSLELKAVNEAALHPQAKVTNNIVNKQATDLSGFYTFLKWLLILSGIGGLIWLAIYLYRGYQEKNSTVRQAQQRAISALNQTMILKDELENQITDLENNGSIVPPFAKNCFDQGSILFSRYGKEERTNPSTPGLTPEEYDEIATQYRSIGSTFTKGIAALHGPTPSTPTVTASAPKPVNTEPIAVTAELADEPTPPKTKVHVAASHSSYESHRHHHHMHEEPETVVVHDSPIYTPAPVVVVEEPVWPSSYRPTSTYSRPIEPDPEPTPSRSSFSVSNDDDDRPTRGSSLSMSRDDDDDNRSSSSFSSAFSNSSDDSDDSDSSSSSSSESSSSEDSDS